MNKKPPELHVIDGTANRSKRGAALLPQNIRKRTPKAEWIDNPDSWDKEQFIEETAAFLFEVYGIGNEQDKHILAMLADHIDTYVNCTRNIRQNTIIIKYNNGATTGPNPFLSVRNKTTTLIVQLMNELGLTPRSRLASGKVDDDTPMAKLMRGPKG